jgi:hypothetical protein
MKINRSHVRATSDVCSDAIAAFSNFSKHVFSERKHLFQEGYYKATKLEEAVKKGC